MNIKHMNIDMRKAWHAAGYKGRGIIFAVLDTGVLPVDYLKCRVLPGTPDGLKDTDGHGTFVAGQLLEWCPEAQILSFRVLPKGKGPVEPIIEALEKLLPIVKADPDHRYIVNMSLSGNYNPNSALMKRYEAAIDALVAVGLPVVVAAGNDGEKAANEFPSCFVSPITVSAIDENCKRAKFSTFHNEVDFAAYGVNVKGISLREGIPSTKSGTSMSAPNIAGLIGLLLGRDMDMTEPALYELLKHLAIDLGEGGRDPLTGWGVPDIKTPATIDAPSPTPEPTPVEGETTTMLDKVIDIGLSWPVSRIMRTTTDHIQIHHTVGKYGTPAKWAALQKSRQNQKPNPEKGVPYSYLVLQDGTIYLGRSHEYAHGGVRDDITNKANQRSVAIALDGDMRAENLPTDKQLAAALQLTREIMAIYSVPVDKVLGHNEVPTYVKDTSKPTGKTYATLCPSIDMKAFRAALGTPAQEPDGELYVYAGTNYVNIRSGPGTEYTKLEQLKAGEQCRVLQVKGSWAQIRKGDLTGWCIATWLRKA